MQTVFINIDKCVGCRHCEVACVLAHSSHNDILSYALGDKDAFPRLKVKTGVDFSPLPNRCRHCNPAPCMEVCPSGAIYRDQDTDAVLVSQDRCISCWMCVMLCPFSCMDFENLEKRSNKQKAMKCDTCMERLRQGQDPACVTACKTAALKFGDIADLSDEKNQDKAIDFTLKMRGKENGTKPANLKLFKQIQQKIAEIGPMPASSDY